MAPMIEFFQAGPVLANPFDEDRFLQSHRARRSCARDLVPAEDQARATPLLALND
jgi:hypothetical protein